MGVPSYQSTSFSGLTSLRYTSRVRIIRCLVSSFLPNGLSSGPRILVLVQSVWCQAVWIFLCACCVGDLPQQGMDMGGYRWWWWGVWVVLLYTIRHWQRVSSVWGRQEAYVLVIMSVWVESWAFWLARYSSGLDPEGWDGGKPGCWWMSLCWN